MANYKELVEFVVKYLVTQPEAVSVESSEGEGEVKVMIRVAHEDVGRIIGKRGATINSIRLLAKAAAVKAGERVDVDIVEESAGGGSDRSTDGPPGAILPHELPGSLLPGGRVCAYISDKRRTGGREQRRADRRR